MCTVTFIPREENDFILTSNRDESPMRVSLPPDFYKIEHVEMLFPKDKLSGGSWIGISEQQRTVCLLNGGFVTHVRKAEYRISRGEVVKAALVSNEIETFLQGFDLEGVEPFTMVIVDWNDGLKLFELVWDEEQKHISKLPLVPRIWSSSTLYTEEMKAMRKQWFEAFKLKSSLDAKNMWAFHHKAGIGDSNVDVILDRAFVKTTSVTQIRKEEGDLQMSFEDVASMSVSKKTFELAKV